MIFQLKNLDKDFFPQLPAQCRECGWWQGFDQGWDERDARSWADGAQAAFGSWGKVSLGDGQPLGMIQYGPPELFPRCRKLSCGPVSAGAMLLACGAASHGGLETTLKSLITSILADFRMRRIDKIEAFATDIHDESDSCHFFTSDFLRDCGFYPVRNARGLKIMRLELGGIQPVATVKSHRLGLLNRLKSRAAAPAPVAMAEELKDLAPAGSFAVECR